MKDEPANPVGEMEAAAIPSVVVPAPSLRTVYVANYDLVWRALRRYGVDEAHADDVAQDVFLVVHRRLDDFDATRSMRAWLYGICRRVASDHRRSRQRRAKRLQLVAPPPDGEAVEDHLERRRAAALLGTFLDSIDESARSVFELSEIEGFTGVEVAEALNLNLNTVYAKLRRTRRKLERFIERHRHE
jgi:RNA polymerase sigma-70 factor (ECF subfamily)